MGESDRLLADLSVKTAYGYTASASEIQISNEPKFLRITDIQGGVVDWDTVPYCEIADRKIANYKLHYGDIVVARTGNSTGENYMFDSTETSVFASYLIRYIINQDIAYPNFIWYQMRSQRWIGFINNAKGGSAQAGANAQTMGRFECVVPPLPTQKKIAHILSTLDDKIELNRKMNQTLEEMAQALFRSWFVDFDPVYAKVNAVGREDALGCKADCKSDAELEKAVAALGISKEVLELFPSEFEESEMGMIPKGWEVKKLSSIIKITGGGTPKRTESTYWSGDIPWFSVKDIPSESDVFAIDTEEKITATGLKKSSTKLLPINTTIITARGTVGKIALVSMPMCMNQSCYGINGTDNIGPYFTYYNLKKAVEILKQNVHGAVFDTITTSTFDTYSCPFGGYELTNVFDRFVKSYLEKINNNLHENQTLEKTRDTLLPKLLSGELDVTNLEVS